MEKFEETNFTKWKHSTLWWYSIKCCNSNITSMGPRVLIAVFLIMIVMTAICMDVPSIIEEVDFVKGIPCSLNYSLPFLHWVT